MKPRVLRRNRRILLSILLLGLLLLFSLFYSNKNEKNLEKASKQCKNDFFLPKRLPDCLVSVPVGYQLPFDQKKCLWKTPRHNIGHLNPKHKYYELHVKKQQWVTVKRNVIEINANGGTSQDGLSDIFSYVSQILSLVEFNDTCNRKPMMLDMGAGVGSISAAINDKKVCNREINVLSYVPRDEWIHVGSIMSDRGIPYFLHHFTGSRPVPSTSQSFNIIHCRWCWHHMAGYEVWLREVDRLLAPGGAFIFNFNNLKLNRKRWEKAIKARKWKCFLYLGTIQVCQKSKSITKSKCKRLSISPDNEEIILRNAFCYSTKSFTLKPIDF